MRCVVVVVPVFVEAVLVKPRLVVPAINVETSLVVRHKAIALPHGSSLLVSVVTANNQMVVRQPQDETIPNASLEHPTREAGSSENPLQNHSNAAHATDTSSTRPQPEAEQAEFPLNAPDTSSDRVMEEATQPASGETLGAPDMASDRVVGATQSANGEVGGPGLASLLLPALGGAAQMPAAASASGNNRNLPPIRNADAILGFARLPQSHHAESESQHLAMHHQPMNLKDSRKPAARSTVTPDILPRPNSMPRLQWPAFSGLPTSRENLEDMGREAILLINELMHHMTTFFRLASLIPANSLANFAIFFSLSSRPPSALLLRSSISSSASVVSVTRFSYFSN